MTTILAVRHRDVTAMGGDGQVTLGDSIVKHGADKIRRLAASDVMVGFAGSAADSLALMERFEGMLKKHSHHMARAAVELAKEWRTDRILRRLESVLLAADRERILLISGSGDVIEPDDGVAGVGSGGALATAAARALVRHSSLGTPEIVREALQITSQINLYSNATIRVETV